MGPLRDLHRQALTAVTLLLLTTMGSGCGFQLRGWADASNAGSTSFYVVPGQDEVFASELQRTLKRNGQQVVSTPDEAAWSIRATVLQTARHDTMISNNDPAQVDRHSLSITVKVQISDSTGKLLLERRFSDSQSFANQPLHIASVRDEEELIQRELRQRIAAAIARTAMQLTAKAQPPPVAMQLITSPVHAN